VKRLSQELIAITNTSRSTQQLLNSDKPSVMVTIYSSALTEHAACIVQIHHGDGHTAQRIADEDRGSPLH